jgi:hypothetical protein
MRQFFWELQNQEVVQAGGLRGEAAVAQLAVPRKLAFGAAPRAAVRIIGVIVAANLPDSSTSLDV